MTDISDSLRLLFETSVEDEGDRYVIPVPKELVENGSLSADEFYRVALLNTSASNDVASSPDESGAQQPTGERRAEPATNKVDDSTKAPPVEEGELRTVTIDTLGDQGDGIARVERGFIVIVPGTKPGDKVEIRVTDVQENVAFAEAVSDATVR